MQRDREFTEYVSARLPVLHRTAYLLCGDAHRADDIVASTTMVLYRYWRRARDVDNLDAYVHRILVRTYLGERRRCWARVSLMGEVPEPAAAGSAEDRVDDRDALRAALAGLSRAQRSVLVLRFACDMSVDEAARVLGCSPGNIKSHTSRGLAALRRRLAAQSTAAVPTAVPDARS